MEPVHGVDVSQLRIVIEASDFEEAVRFFRDSLGLPALLAYDNPGDDRVVILHAGSATIEIGTPAHSQVIDLVEGSSEPSPRIRLAFEVTDTRSACTALEQAGGVVLGPPARTPWGSLNARLAGPEGTQLTLFQQLDPGPERAAPTPGSAPSPSRR